jgi:hypothetical protein
VELNRSFALSGNAATGSVGSVTASNTPALTGVAATGSVGTVVYNIVVYQALNTEDCLGWGMGPWGGDTSSGGYYDVAWGGCQVHNPSVGYGDVGSVVASKSFPLTGVSATGEVGTVTPSKNHTLTGVQATGQVGTVYPVIAIGLTGVQVTGYVGTFGVIHSNALTGVQAVGTVGDVCVRGWTTIDTTQNASWQIIQSAQASSWQTLQNSQNADWDLVVTEEC